MSDISFHNAYKLLSDEDKNKIINWQFCKQIYDNIEILIYYSKNSHDFTAIKQYNPFKRRYITDTDYINNDNIVQIENNGIIYYWSINDEDEEDFYDLKILGMIDRTDISKLFILCCQIFLYYYYRNNFDKFDNIYKFSFYYETNGIQEILFIEQAYQIKYNNKFMYYITLQENNKGIISSKKIKDYDHMIRYENDMCGLLVLFS